MRELAGGDRRRSSAARDVGGEHIGLTVTRAGAHLEFDCASGDISVPLGLDARSRFAVDGIYVPEHPGPVRIGDAAEKKPARYAGTVNGRTMTLGVTLVAGNEAVGTFTLTFDAAPRVRKCL